MADFRSNGIARNRLVAGVLTLCVAAVAMAALAVVKYDLLADEAVASPELPIAVSSRLLDFGAVPLNGAVIRHLVVRNDGSDPLHASLVLDDGKYSVTPDKLILHPGVSSRIQVAVKADQPGDLRDRLQIRVDEAAQNAPLVIALRGEATTGDALDAAPAAGVPVAVRPQLRAEAASPVPSSTPGDAPVVDGSPGDTTAGDDGVLIAGVTPSSRVKSGRGGRATATPQTTPSTTARRRVSGDSRDTGGSETTADRDTRQRRGPRVGPYIEGVSVPIGSLAEVPVPVPREVSEYDRQTARELPSRTIRDNELPDRLPEDEAIDDFERDLFDDESAEPEPDPFTRPKLSISASSVIQLIGHNATFYPQEIGLLGSDTGGAFSLTGEITLPMVYLALGESMLYRQTGAVTGEWDRGSGHVTLNVPLETVDADGDAAPTPLMLTTGTVYGRNAYGVVVSKTGTPRDPGSGIVRLVGIFEIPVGFGNSAERQLTVFEILAEMSFGTEARDGFDHRF